MKKHGGNILEICREYGYKKEEVLDFSANINPLGINENVKRKMIEALDEIERYPDITYYDLKKEIARYEDMLYEDIFLGNGAAEVIFNLVRAIEPRKTLLIAPTFSEYEEAIKSINGKILYYNLKKDFKLDDGYLKDIKEDLDMLFICNPNNPTGIVTKKEFIIEVLKKAKKVNCIVVIDESFIEFLEKKEEFSVVDEVINYNNLVVVKSLTKMFAFPGIRIGYGLSKNKKLIKKIDEISISWSVNTVANEGAIASLNEKKYIKDTVEYVKKENKFLYEELKKINGIEIYKGEANFLFFKIKKDIDLRKEMLLKKIIIRSCYNYKNLDENYYRIAVRTREENIKLIEGLKEVIN